MLPYTVDSPAKKQSKWSAEEDALIIELRGSGMKWEDISRRLPGRSAISCRLHYQNYLERRSEWDEEKKNKLARLYERFKPEMWAKVAEEMQVPWRAAEAMHWQLGEADMARRAGVTPFSLTATTVETAASSQHHHQHHHQHQHQHQQQQQQHPQHHHHHHQPSAHVQHHGPGGGSSGSSMSPRYGGRGGNPSIPLPPPPPPPPQQQQPPLSMQGPPGPGLGHRAFGGPGGPPERVGTPGRGSIGGGHVEPPAGSMYHYQQPYPRHPQQQHSQHSQHPQQHQQQQHPHAGPGLAPIQGGGLTPPRPQERMGGTGGGLPSLAEIATGVSPFGSTTPSSYSLRGSPIPGTSDRPGPAAAAPPPYPAAQYPGGPGGFAGPMTGGPDQAGAAGKRRASPDFEPRDQRRRYLQSPRYDDGRGGFHG